MPDEKAVVDRYYELMDVPGRLRPEGRFAEALAAAMDNLDRVPTLVGETRREYGRFDLASIPPIEVGCELAALLRDEPAMDRIAETVAAHRELTPWGKVVIAARADSKTVGSLLRHVRDNPGCVQSTLGATLGADGRPLSSLAYDLALGGMPGGPEKAGRSYALYLAEKSS